MAPFFPSSASSAAILQVYSSVSFKLLSRDRICLSQQPHFTAVTVHQRPPCSVLAHQCRVVLPLHARDSHHVAGL